MSWSRSRIANQRWRRCEAARWSRQRRFLRARVFSRSLSPGGFEPVGTFTVDAGPPAGGGPHEHEVLPFVPGGGGSFRPAASLGPLGNGVQPADGKDAVGLRTSREMRTIAESIDALMEGNVLRAGDLLIQRFKALETSVIDGTWSRARHHELIPEEGVGLASAGERQAISLLELQHGGGQQEIGNRQRSASRAKFGGAPRESTSRGPERYPAGGARGQLEKAKIGCSQREAKGVAAVGGGRPQAGKCRVSLKPGPGKRPWKKKFASVAPKLP